MTTGELEERRPRRRGRDRERLRPFAQPGSEQRCPACAHHAQHPARYRAAGFSPYERRPHFKYTCVACGASWRTRTWDAETRRRELNAALVMLAMLILFAFLLVAAVVAAHEGASV